MRTRAGIVLIEDNKVALIERHRAGLDYFVFPGGGVEGGETVEEGAVREAMEELGVEIEIKRKIAIVHIGRNLQHYFLAERISGEFGSGTGEEFSANPGDPQEGVYIPIWMPIKELSHHEKVHPAEVAKLVLKAQTDGWSDEAVIIHEESS